ncbi:MAG: polyribonucleotide nucleotidyltransferase [Nanoarchaeota archaeon]|nr:polyribonucleotide nucleotidyltransferase [Nanoarchaeota archaeon]
MDLHKKTYTTEVSGSPFTLEISDLAGQASGAVIGSWGDTVVLATCVMGKKEVSLPYFPLTVDYEERFYAAGRILGSRFVRREGRPSDEAVLSARLIDRTIRPLFDHRIRREVQVVITILSYDEKHDPDLVSLVAVSCALGISNIPWGGPVGGARFLKEIETNTNDPVETRGVHGAGANEARTTRTQMEYLAFFAGTENHVNMIELEGNEISEAKAEELFEAGQKQIRAFIEFQKKIIAEIGKKKTEFILPSPDSRVRGLVSKFLKGKLTVGLPKGALYDLKDEFMDYFEKDALPRQLAGQGKEASDFLKVAEGLFEEEVNDFVHEIALKNGERVDGRALDEIRPLHAEHGIFSRTHGSGLFIRGNTQVLAVTTLGPPSGEQLVETMETQEKKRFMLHYNFPDFSVGETGRSRGPGRREIGHGYLAWKAIRAMIPPKDEFPYAIRVVAETLSSNGSSSMATTCASVLSLLDAGVPLKKHVAGIAMGLMTEADDKTNRTNKSNKSYKILTDIQGPEDHHGDMDFKVAGTEDGVTAIQMDVKILGVTQGMFRDVLIQARKARLEILELMKKTLPRPRELSKYAPRIFTLHIDPMRIGELIGPGGKTINGIIADVGGEVSIDIDEDGTVYIASEHKEQADKAIAMVQGLFHDFVVGEALDGTVVRIMEFGAIVSFGGKQDGMVHISELGQEGFVKNVSDVVKMGQKVRVRVVKIENGRIGLSMKGVAQN